METRELLLSERVEIARRALVGAGFAVDRTEGGAEAVKWANEAQADWADLMDELDALAERLRTAERERWRCFHCGFETDDFAEARAHFGDSENEQGEPLCLMWAQLTDEERAGQFQACARELNEARDLATARCLENEDLEGTAEVLHGALADAKAEARRRENERDTAEARVAALEAALRRLRHAVIVWGPTGSINQLDRALADADALLSAAPAQPVEEA